MTLGSNLDTADVSIGSGQTSGGINIGVSVNRTGGAINIGTRSTVANPINIGSSTSTVSIGNTLAVNGALTSTGGITVPSASTIFVNTIETNGSGTGNNLSLANNLTTGNITIGEAQTSGDINIGASSGRLTSGIINIGTLSSVANPINIGSTALSPISLSGPVTIDSAFTLPSTTYTPSTSQLGYMGLTAGTYTYPILCNTTASQVLRVINIPIGFYIVTVSIGTNQAAVLNETLIASLTTSTNCTSYINFTRFNGPLQITSANHRSLGTFSGGVKFTSSTNTFIVSLATVVSTIQCNEAYFSYTRIA